MASSGGDTLSQCECNTYNGLMASDDQPRVPFLAPAIANIMAPVTETVVRGALALPAAETRDVPCRRCGDVIALWARLTRCLYPVTRDGGLGAVPLSKNHCEDVPVHCDRCRKTYRTSGRAVGRNLHNGRPPLA